MNEIEPAPIDDIAVAEFWEVAKVRLDLDETFGFVEAFQFGDSRRMADDLSDLVVNGPKRATCGSVAALADAGEPVPAVGDHWIVCDGAGQPVAVIRTTDVRVGPLSSVDDRFAWDEGEGDRSREFWLDAHTRFFNREYSASGRTMHPDIDVVFERFEVV